MARLELSGLAKTYGDFHAVAGIDLDIAQGELVVLLGPSGCGKTTTLRMIAGFIPPTAGTIRLGGSDITRQPPWKRDTGLVFQSYALFPHLTAAENVAFGLKMRKRPPSVIAAKVDEALRLVRLEGLGERLPRELSGGQQQRVALARALVIEPLVLLLDEPLSNLDAKLRAEVRVEIRDLQRKLGLTTVMVTHDQEEALTMADRLVVMSQGKVQQIGTQRELYERPANAFVAGFLGRTNFLHGRMEAPGSFRSESGLSIRCAVDAARDGRTLALRPERLSIADAPDVEAQNSFPGVVEFASYLGGILEYHVRLTPTDRLLVQTPNKLGHHAHAVGDRVYLLWPAQASLVLADDGGEPGGTTTRHRDYGGLSQ
jgi:putative spermidine/putrescine transport system ATP-binding protein